MFIQKTYVCLSFRLYFCLSAYLSVCLPACLPVSLFVCLFPCIFVRLTVYLFVCLSVRLFICLSVSLPAYVTEKSNGNRQIPMVSTIGQSEIGSSLENWKSINDDCQINNCAHHLNYLLSKVTAITEVTEIGQLPFVSNSW
jgi:hypothetical protein